METENGDAKVTQTRKRQLRKKKSRARRKEIRPVLTPDTPSLEPPVRCPEAVAFLIFVKGDVEVEYVSAPRDFTTFFLDEENGTAQPVPAKKVKSEIDVEMEERRRSRRHRRRGGFSRSSSEEPIDGMAAVNQVRGVSLKRLEIWVGLCRWSWRRSITEFSTISHRRKI